jgi:pSer/pThr/pTyr-binding forkhead associated (FHA) protein
MDEALLLKVGKALDNDVVLNIPFISEYHLEIFRDVQGNVFMTDLNSSNGTFVNGNKLNGFIMLNPKDEVFLGSGFKFQWEQVIKGKMSKDINNQPTKSNVKYSDAYDQKSSASHTINKQPTVKKPFFKEHLDLILIYGFILLFFLYCYVKVS